MSEEVNARPLRVALIGAAGRMGRAITECAERVPAQYEIVAQISTAQTEPAKAFREAEVVIDFSASAATDSVLAACRSARIGLVLGTTGHTDGERELIRQAAEEIPVVFAANFSVGVNALFWLTRQAAKILGPEFDLEIVETHHRLKKDAPSGTARRLVEILGEVRGLDANTDARHGRHGLVGERTSREIGVHAIRGGDVVGEHTVLMAGNGERLELTHRASSRDTFATGALRAASWLVGRPAGLYDMEDVLDLRRP